MKCHGKTGDCGAGPGGSELGSKQGPPADRTGEEAGLAGRGAGLDLSCLARCVPALDYETCSGNYFQPAHVPAVTAYFWIPGVNAWALMTFRGVFYSPSSD